MPFKHTLFLVTLLFLAGFVVGTVSPPDMLVDLGFLQDVSDTLDSSTPLSLFFLILVNNLLVLLFTFVLSPLLCLAPITASFTNGWVIGLVSVDVVQQESLGFVLAGILPHGIIEIPALLIAMAAAIGFGSSLILYIFQRSARSKMLPRLKQNTMWFGLAMLMMPVAAVIEAFLTPYILNHI